LSSTVSDKLQHLSTTQNAAQNERLEKFAQELTRATQGLDGRFEQLRTAVEKRLADLQSENAGKLDEMRRTVNEKLQAASEAGAQQRAEAAQSAAHEREERAQAQAQLSSTVSDKLQHLSSTQNTAQTERLENFAQELSRATQGLDGRFEQLRTAVEKRLDALQSENAGKLDEMRRTVDEKLHATLEQRLGDSFRLVSERLELVHKGLGEMQTLAAGVGDLKKVLTNVKTRGTWGEVQLAALLEQVLTAEQYDTNVVTRPGGNERVEFAIRLPGNAAAGPGERTVNASPVWLPIDAKFPVEDYQRLVDAQERADPAAVESAAKALEMRLREEAKKIRDKYVEPPHTTDFAILYLPTEGLYAEALRRPGLAEALQRDCRISLAGPTTLAALLNSLQMGFRTLAIEKRSSEVWAVLGAVKTEFGKFGDALDSTRKKLELATRSIESAGVRTRQIERRLKGVEALPLADAQARLGVLEVLEEAVEDEV
jgi:DNA recombination protein RmuC